MHASMWMLTWLYRCLRQLTVPVVWLLSEPYRRALLPFRQAVAKLIRKAFWGSKDALQVRTQPPCVICSHETSMQNRSSSHVTFLQPNVSRLSSLQNGGANHSASLQNGGPDHVISQLSENSIPVMLQRNGGVDHVSSLSQDGGCSVTSSLQSEDSCPRKASLESGSSDHVMSPLLSTSHGSAPLPGSIDASTLSHRAACHVAMECDKVTKLSPPAVCGSEAAGWPAVGPCQTLPPQTGPALAAAPGFPVENLPFQFCLHVPETRC